MKIIFETPRLFLRTFTKDDAHLIFLLNSDPEIVKYVHEPVLENEQQAKEILINNILPQYKLNLGRWAVYIKDNSKFIGWCGLKFIEQSGIYDLGYRFMKSTWGKGYATEAAKYTIDYGLQKLKIPLITGMAHIENIASAKVLENCGMQFVKFEIIDNIPVKVYTISSHRS